MPPAHLTSSLKTVAEAVTGLLTMLLQFMIQHLEAMPDDAETPSEMMGVMTGMVQELQNQRSVRQSLMTTSLRPKTAQRKAPETQLEIQSWPVLKHGASLSEVSDKRSSSKELLWPCNRLHCN